MAATLMKAGNIQFVRPGLSMSEVIDEKIEQHVNEVRILHLGCIGHAWMCHLSVNIT